MSTQVLSRLLLGISTAGSIAFTSLAMADTQDNKPASLDKVTVSARDWEESDDAVPESLVVVDGGDIALQGLDVLETRVPNIRIERSSVQTRIVSRGLSGIDTGLQDPLAYYLNGVALPQGGNQLPQLADIDQLEFLKGPQGSLYGRNSEAGLVKINTLSPDWKPRISANLSTQMVDGSDGYEPGTVASLRASNALIDNSLAGAIAVRVEDSQGPYHNLANDNDDGGKVKGWTVSTGLTFNSQANTLIDLRSIIEQKDAGKSRMRFLSGGFATDRFTTNYNSPTFDNSRSAIHTLKIEHGFDGFDVTATTGYTDYHREFQADLDSYTLPSPETLMDMDDTMVSQEMRLSSDKQGRLRWLAGVYVFKQSTDIDFRIGAPRAVRISDLDHKGAAIFGQIDLLLTEKISLTLGSRLEDSRQNGTQDYALMKASAHYEMDVDTHKHLPKATLSYAFNDASLAYLSLARGYLPGGYNYAFANSNNNFTYTPEVSDNLELGYKFNTEKFSFNAAAFAIRTRNKQIVDIEPGNIQRISNAAQTRSYGVEMLLDYHFTTAFSAYATLGTQRAEADDYVRNIMLGKTLAPVNLNGNKLPMSPAQTYAAGVKYQAGSTGFFGRASVNGASHYYFDSFNQLEQPAYTKIEAETGYQFKTIKISLAAANLTDKDIYSRALSLPTGTLVEDTSPRTFTLNISANW